MIKLPKITIHTTRFQQFFIFFTVIYLATMLILQYNQSYFAEENPKLTKIEDQAERLTSIVEAGFHINNFPKFDFQQNSFIVDGVVWFKFPIGNESLQTIQRFSFQNGEILSKSEPMIQIINKDVLIRYHIVIKFSTTLNYKYFPVSNHKLTLILQNKSVSPYELYFIGDKSNLNLSKSLLSGNWEPTKTYVDYGYLETTPKYGAEAFKAHFPSIAFTIDFENRDLRHFIILYIPLFLLFLLIFASLLTPVEKISLRLPIVAGVTPILALHSLVVENLSPPGSYMTKIDQTYFSLLALSFLILLFQSYLALSLGGIPKNNMNEENKKKKKQLKQINDFLIIIVLIALIISLTYTTYFA